MVRLEAEKVAAGAPDGRTTRSRAVEESGPRMNEMASGQPSDPGGPNA